MAEAPPKSSSDQHAPKSSSDLLASAKILAEAAESGYGKDGAPFDKAKVAGAAEDVLEAAKGYGKLNESSGVGQYVDKAEDYLHNLHTSSDSSPAVPAAAPAASDEKKADKPAGGDEG
ncbi:hypothetical protein PJI21_28815, partial [Mycobacterium kansasii]